MALELLVSIKVFFNFFFFPQNAESFVGISEGQEKIFCRIIRDIRQLNLLVLLAFGSSSWIVKDRQTAAFR